MHVQQIHNLVIRKWPANSVKTSKRFTSTITCVFRWGSFTGADEHSTSYTSWTAHLHSLPKTNELNNVGFLCPNIDWISFWEMIHLNKWCHCSHRHFWAVAGCALMYRSWWWNTALPHLILSTAACFIRKKLGSLLYISFTLFTRTCVLSSSIPL